MSNVVELRPKQAIVSSHINLMSEAELAHEVTRYCLEMMLNSREISQREFDLATDFVDSAYLFDHHVQK